MKVELSREIDGHFLLNEHGDPHLSHIYIYSIRTVLPMQNEKVGRNL